MRLQKILDDSGGQRKLRKDKSMNAFMQAMSMKVTYKNILS